MKNKIQGGIICAGHGERFQRAGFNLPKPLIKAAGTSLIGHTVAAFRDAGIFNLVIVLNSLNFEPCSSYLVKKFQDMGFNFICRDTATSAETFLTLISNALSGRMVVTTVDSIFEEGVFRKFVSHVKLLPDDSICLGVSSYIDDEKPLYAEMDISGRITALGKKAGHVTCGVYSLDPASVRGYKAEGFTALRQLLGRFLDDGLSVTGFDMGRVIDIDRPEDLEKAENFIENRSMVMERGEGTANNI